MNSNTLNALFIGISENRAAALVSAFHRLGYVCRHNFASEMGALGHAIRNDKPDLLLFNQSDAPIDLQTCLDAIKNNPVDLPVIVLSDDAELLPDHQIADVLNTDDNARVARSCLREFWALQTRRRLKATEAQLEAAEERSELIMSQSDDAIAYVADGMIISVNKSFAATFGFDDADDLDCLPIIDLIDEQDQDRLKNALRGLDKAANSNTQISLNAHQQDGSSIEVNMLLSMTTLDGEDCVQFALHDENADSNVGGNASQDTTTGFSTSDRFTQRLEDVAAHGLGRGLEGALLLISLDNYTELRAEHGISGADLIIQDLADLLIEFLPKAEFGRVASDAIGSIISGYSSEEALAKASSLCQQAAQRSASVDSSLISYTLSIAVLPLGTSKQLNGQKLLDEAIALCEEIRDFAGGNGNKAELYVRARQTLTLTEDPAVLFEDAKSDKRLQLLFQPIVSLAEDEKHYYEISLALKDQEPGEISGEELITAFETLGDNTELDRWIIVEATKQMLQSHNVGKNTRLIINLSSNVFRDKGLTPWLGVALKAAKLEADALVFQFRTESCAKALKPARAFADKFRALGANLSLRSNNPADDKNTLTQLQPLLTKLDRDIQDSDGLSSAIQGVQEAGSKAIVTGVESAAALATLWQLKPDYVQGSYIHPPSQAMDYDFGED